MELAQVKDVKNLWTSTLPLALVTCLSAGPAFAQEIDDEYQQWVDYRDGQISVAFAHIPVPIALTAIRARTGLEIILPRASEIKSLSLRLSQIALEPAVRSLLFSIGFRSFALMYDESGRPSRAIVLEQRQEEPASGAADSADASQISEHAAKPLTAEEREKLQKQLERWSELKQEDRVRLEGQLKALPPSEEREQLVKEYGRQVLALKN
ncbi:MAG TPA: hypothetical protein VFU31_11240 [Candidatus Binatia bacterium]|nr:hypothetical protein [Candidatus Binatia bacterium]